MAAQEKSDLFEFMIERVRRHKRNISTANLKRLEGGLPSCSLW